MNDQFATIYSDLTTEPPDPVKFKASNNCTSGSGLGRQISTAGYVIEDLEHPAAKTINALAPVTKEHRSDLKKSTANSGFENAAKKIFTKELLTSNLVDISRTETLSNYGVSSFEEDLRMSLIAESKKRRKAGKTIGGNQVKNTDNSGFAYTLNTVRFSKVTIQEYPLQPGRNPGGNKGCPLAIGWEPISTETVDLDVFEASRTGHRRGKEQLKLVSEHREHILLEMGYTSNEIAAATKSANKARRGRYETIARLKSTRSLEMLEDFRDNLHNFVTFGMKKRREEQFLAPFNDPGKTPRDETTVRRNLGIST